MSWTCLMSMTFFLPIWSMCNKIWVNTMSTFNLINGDKKSSHLCTPTSKCSSLTDSTECIWMVTYFPSFFLIFHMNNLSISRKMITNHWNKSHKNIQNIILHKFTSYTKLNFKTNISNQNIEVYLSIYNTLEIPTNGITWWTLKFTNVKFSTCYQLLELNKSAFYLRIQCTYPWYCWCWLSPNRGHYTRESWQAD